MIKVYYNDKALSDGDLSNPLVVGPLNASDNEVSAPIELKVKTDAGYVTRGNTVISFEGTTAAKWEVCDSQSGSYASSLTISEVINNTGKTIYVKAKATSDEQPVNDKSVKIKTVATIAAAE